MNIHVFKDQCQKLLSKYGNKTLTPLLLNDTWSLIKQKDDDFIIERVAYVLSNKPINSSFELSDLVGEAVNYEIVEIEPKPTRIKRSGDRPIYKAKMKRFNNKGALEKVLKEYDADSALDAMNKILNKKKLAQKL